MVKFAFDFASAGIIGGPYLNMFFEGKLEPFGKRDWIRRGQKWDNLEMSVVWNRRCPQDLCGVTPDLRTSTMKVFVSSTCQIHSRIKHLNGFCTDFSNAITLILFDVESLFAFIELRLNSKSGEMQMGNYCHPY